MPYNQPNLRFLEEQSRQNNRFGMNVAAMVQGNQELVAVMKKVNKNTSVLAQNAVSRANAKGQPFNFDNIQSALEKQQGKIFSTFNRLNSKLSKGFNLDWMDKFEKRMAEQQEKFLDKFQEDKAEYYGLNYNEVSLVTRSANSLISRYDSVEHQQLALLSGIYDITRYDFARTIQRDKDAGRGSSGNVIENISNDFSPDVIQKLGMIVKSLPFGLGMAGKVGLTALRYLVNPEDIVDKLKVLPFRMAQKLGLRYAENESQTVLKKSGLYSSPEQKAYAFLGQALPKLEAEKKRIMYLQLETQENIYGAIAQLNESLTGRGHTYQYTQKGNIKEEFYDPLTAEYVDRQEHVRRRKERTKAITQELRRDRGIIRSAVADVLSIVPGLGGYVQSTGRLAKKGTEGIYAQTKTEFKDSQEDRKWLNYERDLKERSNIRFATKLGGLGLAAATGGLGPMMGMFGLGQKILGAPFALGGLAGSVAGTAGSVAGTAAGFYGAHKLYQFGQGKLDKTRNKLYQKMIDKALKDAGYTGDTAALLDIKSMKEEDLQAMFAGNLLPEALSTLSSIQQRKFQKNIHSEAKRNLHKTAGLDLLQGGFFGMGGLLPHLAGNRAINNIINILTKGFGAPGETADTEKLNEKANVKSDIITNRGVKIDGLSNIDSPIITLLTAIKDNTLVGTIPEKPIYAVTRTYIYASGTSRHWPEERKWPEFAKGGKVTPGQPAWVGEKGPEILFQHPGSKDVSITPLHKMKGFAEGTDNVAGETVIEQDKRREAEESKNKDRKTWFNIIKEQAKSNVWLGKIFKSTEDLKKTEKPKSELWSKLFKVLSGVIGGALVGKGMSTLLDWLFKDDGNEDHSLSFTKIIHGLIIDFKKGGLAGAMSGTLMGATIGATIGAMTFSPFGIIGGMFLGGALGGLLGWIGGTKLYDDAKEAWDKFDFKVFWGEVKDKLMTGGTFVGAGAAVVGGLLLGGALGALAITPFGILGGALLVAGLAGILGWIGGQKIKEAWDNFSFSQFWENTKTNIMQGGAAGASSGALVGAVIGGSLGVLTGNPFGIVGGAVLFGGLGAVLGWIGGQNIKAAWDQFNFRNFVETNWDKFVGGSSEGAIVGGMTGGGLAVLGSLAGIAFLGPIGLVGSLLLGGAIGSVLGYINKPEAFEKIYGTVSENASSGMSIASTINASKNAFNVTNFVTQAIKDIYQASKILLNDTMRQIFGSIIKFGPKALNALYTGGTLFKDLKLGFALALKKSNPITNILFGMFDILKDGYDEFKKGGSFLDIINKAFVTGDGGFMSMLKGISKYAAIGALAGMPFPIIGPMIGGLAGTIIGGIIGWFGDKRILDGITNMGKNVYAAVYENAPAPIQSFLEHTFGPPGLSTDEMSKAVEGNTSTIAKVTSDTSLSLDDKRKKLFDEEERLKAEREKLKRENPDQLKVEDIREIKRQIADLEEKKKQEDSRIKEDQEKLIAKTKTGTEAEKAAAALEYGKLRETTARIGTSIQQLKDKLKEQEGTDSFTKEHDDALAVLDRQIEDLHKSRRRMETEASRNPAAVPLKAGGGPIPYGTPFIAGDGGPMGHRSAEMIIPTPGGVHVLNNNDTMAMFGDPLRRAIQSGQSEFSLNRYGTFGLFADGSDPLSSILNPLGLPQNTSKKDSRVPLRTSALARKTSDTPQSIPIGPDSTSSSSNKSIDYLRRWKGIVWPTPDNQQYNFDKFIAKAHGGVDLDNLIPEVKASLFGLASDYYDKFKKKLGINSAFRDFKRQEQIFKSARPGYAARPGNSPHNFGYAFDMTGKAQTKKELESSGLLNKWHFSYRLPHEPWHMEDTQFYNWTGMQKQPLFNGDIDLRNGQSPPGLTSPDKSLLGKLYDGVKQGWNNLTQDQQQFNAVTGQMETKRSTLGSIWDGILKAISGITGFFGGMRSNFKTDPKKRRVDLVATIESERKYIAFEKNQLSNASGEYRVKLEKSISDREKLIKAIEKEIFYIDNPSLAPKEPSLLQQTANAVTSGMQGLKSGAINIMADVKKSDTGQWIVKKSGELGETSGGQYLQSLYNTGKGDVQSAWSTIKNSDIGKGATRLATKASNTLSGNKPLQYNAFGDTPEARMGLFRKGTIKLLNIGTGLSGHFASLESKYGLPSNLLTAIAMQESGGNANSVGDGGKAIGMFQIHPGTASDLGLNPANRRDPYQSAEAAAKYLSQNYRTAKRKSNASSETLWKYAIAGYNWGPGGMAEYIRTGRWPGKGDPNYIKNVLSKAKIGNLSIGPNDVASAPIAGSSSSNDEQGLFGGMIDRGTNALGNVINEGKEIVSDAADEAMEMMKVIFRGKQAQERGWSGIDEKTGEQVKMARRGTMRLYAGGTSPMMQLKSLMGGYSNFLDNTASHYRGVSSSPFSKIGKFVGNTYNKISSGIKNASVYDIGDWAGGIYDKLAGKPAVSANTSQGLRATMNDNPSGSLDTPVAEILNGVAQSSNNTNVPIINTNSSNVNNAQAANNLIDKDVEQFIHELCSLTPGVVESKIQKFAIGNSTLVV